MFTYDQYPKDRRRHLRITNVVEFPFAAVRLRMSEARRFREVGRATAIIRRLPRVAQNAFVNFTRRSSAATFFWWP